MKILLVHERLSKVISIDGFAVLTDRVKAREMQLKAHRTILLSLGDKVLRVVAEEETTIEV